MKRRIIGTAILAAVAWLLLSGAAVAQQYVFQDLGNLGGGWAEAWGLNDSGQVVGQSDTADLSPHAYVWDPTTNTMLDLGDLGTGVSIAYAINNLGQVAGSAYLYNANAGYDELHPVLWDAAHTINDLGNLNGNGFCEFYALNDNGRAAGYIIGGSVDSQYAFTWDPVSLRHLLPNLSAPPYFTTAYGINNQGEVVGDSQDQNYNVVAFFCSPPGATQLTKLGTLGGTSSTAYALNNNSQVVGVADTPQGIRHAFLWDSVNHMQDLDPSFLFGDSEANAINSAGQVVGIFNVYSYPSSAFLWTPARGMQDLNSLVVDLPPGTNLDVAYGINKTGQIVGNYSSTTGSGAFLLTPVQSVMLQVYQLLLME